jgi:hypothetical protein
MAFIIGSDLDSGWRGCCASGSLRTSDALDQLVSECHQPPRSETPVALFELLRRLIGDLTRLIGMIWLATRPISAHVTCKYAVLNHVETELVGCVYIDPPGEGTPDGADALVSWWVVDRELGGDLDRSLNTLVPSWLADRWGFQQVTLEAVRTITSGCKLANWTAAAPTSSRSICADSMCRGPSQIAAISRA